MQFNANGWLDVAQEIDYTSKSMSREGYGIKYIILHGTAGGSSAANIGNYFATSDVQASAHIIIDQEGNIVQGIPLSLAAWGNGVITGKPATLPFRTAGDGVNRDYWWNANINPNWVTVSIEHVKPSTDNSDQITPAQQAASFAVIKAVCDTYGVPKRFADANGGVTGHFSMDTVNRSRCPGPYPWQELFDYLNGNEEEPMPITLTTPGVSQFFKANGATWQCLKTGFLIGGGILGLYQKFGGDGLCGLTYLGLPASNEISVPGHPGVTVQEFERGCLRWDPQHTIDSPPGAGDTYTVHVEQDPRFVGLQAQLSALKTQNSLLQSQVADLENQLDSNVQAQTIAALQIKIEQAQKDLS